jgi:acyl dehydratase
MAEPIDGRASSPGGLYLDDLSVGMRFESSSLVVSEADIKRFAGEFDPQPFHLDHEAALATVFRGLAASGWHTAALTMRLLAGGGMPLADGVIGMGVEITWAKPVRPGDALRVASTITELRRSASKPGQGVVTVLSETLNGANEVVQRLVSRLLVFVRPPPT